MGANKQLHGHVAKGRAFTLIELISTIGIICVLIALLIPYARKSIQAARTVKCTSNLHQLGVAVYSYAGENNGNLPFYYSDQPGAAWSGYAPLWFVQVAPYAGSTVKSAVIGELENPGVFICPSDAIPWVGGTHNNFSCSYAYPLDLSVHTAGVAPKLTSFQGLPDTVMLVDSVSAPVFNYRQLNSASVGPNDSKESWATLQDRHDGLNAVFLDGHCELLRKPVGTAAPPDRPNLWNPLRSN